MHPQAYSCFWLNTFFCDCFSSCVLQYHTAGLLKVLRSDLQHCLKNKHDFLCMYITRYLLKTLKTTTQICYKCYRQSKSTILCIFKLFNHCLQNTCTNTGKGNSDKNHWIPKLYSSPEFILMPPWTECPSQWNISENCCSCFFLAFWKTN